VNKAEAFIQEYDKVQKYWHQMSSGKDGKIDLDESGLSFDEFDPNHPFVRELSNIEEDEVFKEITDEFHMTHFAVRAYLWNKYPDFPRKWDSGAGKLSKAQDGTIQAAEYKKGGLEQLVEDIKTMIPKQRDRELLVSRPLFSKPGLGIFHFGKSVEKVIQAELRAKVLRM